MSGHKRDAHCQDCLTHIATTSNPRRSLWLRSSGTGSRSSSLKPVQQPCVSQQVSAYCKGQRSTECPPSGSRSSLYSSGVTAKGGPADGSFDASTGNINVTSLPPGTRYWRQLLAQLLRMSGLRAHRNLPEDEHWVRQHEVRNDRQGLGMRGTHGLRVVPASVIPLSCILQVKEVTCISSPRLAQCAAADAAHAATCMQMPTLLYCCSAGGLPQVTCFTFLKGCFDLHLSLVSAWCGALQACSTCTAPHRIVKELDARHSSGAQLGQSVDVIAPTAAWDKHPAAFHLQFATLHQVHEGGWRLAHVELLLRRRGQRAALLSLVKAGSPPPPGSCAGPHPICTSHWLSDIAT